MTEGGIVGNDRGGIEGVDVVVRFLPESVSLLCRDHL